ncbi:unnamed protein product, partial [Lymnaea stagnalis]
FQVCCAPDSANSIFSIKFSDLPASKYNYFLYGFKDEKDFEEFKQDLKDFQKLKRGCSVDVPGGDSGQANYAALKEDLELICRPNNVCKNRRKSHHARSDTENRRLNDAQSSCDSSQPRPSADPSPPGGVENLVSRRPDPKPFLRTPSSETRISRPDSFGLRADFDRRSGLFGFDRRSGIRTSIRDILMEFINGDEHFQEFERVFDTVKNSKTSSRNMENARRLSGHNENTVFRDVVDNRREVDEPSRYVDDIFADFFDNDETFQEFEKEFEKFRSARKSSLLGSISSLGSSRDIFGDLKSYCDRNNVRSRSGSLVSVNSCSSHDEATPSCGDEPGSCDLIWRSVEDWEKILRKMRRNSRLLLDANPRDCAGQQRHSMYGLSQGGTQPERYQKTQSLADLSRCHGNDTTTYRPAKDFIRNGCSLSVDDLSPSPSTRSHYVNSPARDSTHVYIQDDSIDNSIDDDDTSSGQWSDNLSDKLNVDSRYSSSSTLCSSGDEDISCSLSCSCCSDLHIDEDTDDELPLPYSQSPTSRNRSHSLMEFSHHDRPKHLGFHASSADNLLHCSRHHGSSRSFSDLRRKEHTNSVHGNLQYTKDNASSSSDLTDRPMKDKDTDQICDVSVAHRETTPGDGDSSTSSPRWSRSSSPLSQLSEVDSEQYHTASSDLSADFSTAKSDLTGYLASSGLRSGHWPNNRRQMNVSGSDSVVSRRTDDWVHSRGGETFGDHQTVISGPYHSYHGKDGRKTYKERYRPRSGSACQYTCHQHCVPAVTLNCKSISDDGVEVTVPKTPTPTEPRSQLETSLSLGNINARPGCARNVTISSPKSTDLSAVTAHHSSDYPPQTQGGGYDSGVTPPRGGSNVYAGVYHGQSIPPSSNLTLSSNTLPRSVSEGYVTAHLSPQQGPTVTAPRTSQGFSSPYSTPPSANIDPGSNPSSTLQRPNIQSSLLSPVISCEDKVGSSDQVTQENSSSSHDISSYNRSGAEGPLPQHTLLTDRENNPDETTEKDETDSGYRSGTIPDDKLPRVPSQETLDLQELKRKIAKFNHFVPAATLELTDKESFQGFVKVTMNLIRPITMELGARPPSIYELLTREHIIEENTQQVAFYMPRDTHKSLHITSETTTKEVVTSLLKKFHILDHPRKFAMYEQEFSDRNKLVRLRRLTDKDFPLRAILTWNPERIKNYRMVLQENETGEIVVSA